MNILGIKFFYRGVGRRYGGGGRIRPTLIFLGLNGPFL